MLNRLNRYKYNKDEIKRAVRGVDPPAFMDNPAFRVVKGKLFATIGPNTLRVVANEDRDAPARAIPLAGIRFLRP